MNYQPTDREVEDEQQSKWIEKEEKHGTQTA